MAPKVERNEIHTRQLTVTNIGQLQTRTRQLRSTTGLLMPNLQRLNDTNEIGPRVRFSLPTEIRILVY